MVADMESRKARETGPSAKVVRGRDQMRAHKGVRMSLVTTLAQGETTRGQKRRVVMTNCLM